MQTNKHIGNIGEKFAQKKLKENYYKIIDTNYFSRYGEIDIIAIKENILVFIEVKTRTKNSLLLARDSVNNKKREKIKKTALIYMNDFKGDYYLRFDVFEVEIDINYDIINFMHLEDVF